MTEESSYARRHPDDVLPPEVRRLLAASSDADREAYWGELVARHTPLLLRVAHATFAHYDDAMDAYAAVLELLRADDFRRIRGYLGDGRCKFTTWLVVVARRGCIDFARHRYGRTDGQSATNGAKQAVRRELASRLRSVEDVDVLLDAWDNRPDARLRAKEMHAGLGKSLAALPPDERLIMKLRFSDELSAREIAEATGAQSPFHVYRRITAILTKLRRLLASDGIDGSAP